ncbi:hypothetical protein B795N_03090 [Marinilactibacillus psychrotolerans]|uniref:Uncharacterized protein n=1 Tax=Marinilactibacillus psychrotolerans 42ea TaxID=1255609 RepID=A0A1R4KIW2_9LACT|nr:hypothetical protein B795N_03090 [Marinilactibacillus psychrotolerans]SJN44270.1 hypothetical protein FM115_10480 [Marinilactibacillus psychrotolerans 42ea]
MGVNGILTNVKKVKIGNHSTLQFQYPEKVSDYHLQTFQLHKKKI